MLVRPESNSRLPGAQPTQPPVRGGDALRSLSTRVFETRTATGREHFAYQDSGVFQIFILSSLMEKRYVAMKMWLCEDKLKGKTAHFQCPSASQKRAFLSSLIITSCYESK